MKENRKSRWFLIPLLIVLMSLLLAPAASAANPVKGTAEGVVAGKAVTFSTSIWESHIKATYDGVTYLKNNDENWYKTYDFFDSDPGRTEIVLADSIGGVPVRNAVKFMDTAESDDPGKGSRIRRIVLGKNIEEIFSSFAYNHPALEEVTIPQNSKLAEIDSNAFSGCKKLQRIGVGSTDRLPASLAKIWSYAFDHAGLRSVDLSGTAVTSLEECAFVDCDQLQSAILPGHVQYIGTMAFGGCRSLTEITFPKSTQSIAGFAFEHCTALKTVTLQCGVPSGVRDDGTKYFARIGTRAFRDIHPDAVISIPRGDEAEYEDALSCIYGMGDAPASAKLRNIGSTRVQKAPTGVAVTDDCLSSLRGREGITVDTGNAASSIGCAAIIRITGNAGGANLAATANNADIVYWSSAKAYSNENGVNENTHETYTGRRLTESMRSSVYHSDTHNPSVSLTRTISDKRFGFYFYFPVAINQGTAGMPETTTVGEPVLVVYQPSETFVPVMEADYPYPASYFGEDWGPALSKGHLVDFVARGFESLLPQMPELGHNAVAPDGSKMTYQWYHSDDRVIGNGDDTAIPGSSGPMVYNGYWRLGNTDDLLWGAAYPSESFRQNLTPGIHTLYVKATMTVGSGSEARSFSVNSASFDFYRYDLQVLEKHLFADVQGPAVFVRDVPPQGTYREYKIYSADQGADLLYYLYFDFSDLPADVAAGYQQFEDYIGYTNLYQRFSDSNHGLEPNPDKHDQYFQNKLTMKVDTALLTGFSDDTNPGVQDGKADEVRLSGTLHLKFPVDRYTKDEGLDAPSVLLRASGKVAPESTENVFDIRGPWWDIRDAAGQDWRLYIKESIKDIRWFKLKGTMEIYQLRSPDEPGGGKLWYTADWTNGANLTTENGGRVLRLNCDRELPYGASYYYALFRYKDGSVCKSPVFTQYREPEGITVSIHKDDGPSSTKVYLGPGAEKDIRFPLTATNVRLFRVQVEYALHPNAADEEYRELPGSGMGMNVLDFCTESISGRDIVKKGYLELTLRREHNGEDLFTAYANGGDTLYIRFGVTVPDSFGFEPVYFEPIEVRRSDSSPTLTLKAFQGGNTQLKGTSFPITNASTAPILLTASHDGGADMNIRWTVKSSYGYETILSKDKPTMPYGGSSEQLIETQYQTTSSSLSLPIPKDKTSRRLVISAQCENADGTAGASSDSVTVIVNPMDKAEQPSAYISGDTRLLVPTGQTENLPAVYASGSVGDGGTLTWQWYKALDNRGQGATPIENARGIGEKAELQLTPEDVKANTNLYVFCRYTNTNPAASVEKTASKDSNTCLIEVSDQLCAVEAPVPEGKDSYVFTYRQGEKVPASPFTLTVDKPAPLKNVPSGEGPYPVVQDVVFEYRMTDAETGEYLAGNTFFLRNYITRQEVGGKYIYTADLSHTGLQGGEYLTQEIIFQCHWTITNKIDSTNGLPSNLATGRESMAVSSPTAFITRKQLEAPAFLPWAPSENCARFAKGTPVEELTFNGDPVRGFAQVNSTDYGYARPVDYQLTVPEGEEIEVYVEYLNPDGSVYDLRCMKTDPDDSIEIDYEASALQGDVNFVRLASRVVRKDPDTGRPSGYSALARSEIFGVRWVGYSDALVNAETPVFAGKQTTRHYWDPEKAPSYTIDQTGWSVSDGGELSYSWTEYFSTELKDGTAGVTVDPVTGSLTLTPDCPVIQAASPGKTIDLELTVTNLNGKASGKWLAAKTARFKLTIGSLAEKPVVELNASRKDTSFVCGEEEPMKLTAVVTNSASCAEIRYDWHILPVAIDGAAVKAEPSPAQSSMETYIFGKWGSGYTLNLEDGYRSIYLNNSFWTEHTSLDLQVWCEVSNYDASATASSTTSVETERVTCRITRPAYPDGTVTVIRRDDRGKVIEKLTNPATVQMPENGSLTFSVKPGSDYSYQWHNNDRGTQSPGGAHGDKSSYTITASQNYSPFVFCKVSRTDKNDRSYAEVTTPVVMISAFDPAQAQKPVITVTDTAAYALPGENLTFTVNAISPDGGTLKYQWSKLVGGEWMAAGSSDHVSFRAREELGPYTPWKLVITNENPACAVSTATTVFQPTLTVMGVRMTLPEPMPACVTGQPYQAKLNVEMFSSNQYIDVSSFTAPEGYRVEKIENDFFLLSDSAKPVENGTLTVTFNTVFGASEASTVSAPLNIKAKSAAIAQPKLTAATINTAEKVSLGTLTAAGVDKPYWKLNGAPAWLTVDPATGELFAENTPDRPGWFDLTVSVSSRKDGKALDTLALRVPLKAPVTSIYLYTPGQHVLNSAADRSGAGWSWDSTIGVLTLKDGFSGERISSSSPLYLKLEGSAALSSESYEATLSAPGNSIYLMADRPAVLNVSAAGSKGTANAVKCSVLHLDDQVTLNVSATGTSEQVVGFASPVEVTGGGKLNVDVRRTAFSDSIACAFLYDLTVRDSASVTATVSGQGSDTFGAGRLHTYGTGDVSITVSSTASCYGVKGSESEIAHTGGTVTLKAQPGRAISVNTLTADTARYDIQGDPEGEFVSYTPLDPKAPPVLRPSAVSDLTIPRGFTISDNAVVLEAAGGGTFTWTASGLPEGLSLIAEGSRAHLSGTPHAAGTFTPTVTVKTEYGKAQRTFTLIVTDISLAVDSTNSRCDLYEGTLYLNGGDRSDKRPKITLKAFGTDKTLYAENLSDGKIVIEKSGSGRSFLFDTSASPVDESGTLRFTAKADDGTVIAQLELPYLVVNPTPEILTVGRQKIFPARHTDGVGDHWRWDHQAGLLSLNGMRGAKVPDNVYVDGSPLNIRYKGRNVIDDLSTYVYFNSYDACSFTLEGAPGASLEMDLSSGNIFSQGDVTFRGGSAAFRTGSGCLIHVNGEYTAQLTDMESFLLDADMSQSNQRLVVRNSDPDALYAEAGSFASGFYLYAGTVFPAAARLDCTANEVITAGGTRSFTASAPDFTATDGGVIAPRYQWYKNGEVLPGETSSTLTISSADVGEVDSTADFFCEITYPAYKTIASGSDITDAFTVTVEAPTSFTADLTVTAEGVTFTMNADAAETGVIMAAGYSNAGQMLCSGVYEVTVDSSGQTITVTGTGFAEADYVKLFFLDGSTYVPLYPAFVK